MSWARDLSDSEASLVALRLAERTSRSRIMAAMTEAGFTDAVSLSTMETDPENCFHVVAPIAIRRVAPFLGVAERRFWFVPSVALVPGASTTRVPMIWRKHQVTSACQRLHQKHALCIAAAKPVRKQNQRMSVRG